MTKLFHYTRLDTAIEHILPKKLLRTNSLQRMNDPRENQPWQFGGVNINYKGSYPETYSDKTHIDHQYFLGNEIKNSVQILCFVSDKSRPGFLNEIMWAHYSDNHRGICLELDETLFLRENSERLGDFVLEPVTYGLHGKLSLLWQKDKDKYQNINKFARERYQDLFLRKSKYWEMENEKRLILFNENQRYLSIKQSLTGIYFGLQMPNSYSPSINQLIDSTQTKLYDLYYESNSLKAMERELGERRQLVTKQYSTN